MSKTTKQLVYLHSCEVERNQSNIFLHCEKTVAEKGRNVLRRFFSFRAFNLLSVKSTLPAIAFDECAKHCCYIIVTLKDLSLSFRNFSESCQTHSKNYVYG